MPHPVGLRPAARYIFQMTSTHEAGIILPAGAERVAKLRGPAVRRYKQLRPAAALVRSTTAAGHQWRRKQGGAVPSSSSRQGNITCGRYLMARCGAARAHSRRAAIRDAWKAQLVR